MRRIFTLMVAAATVGAFLFAAVAALQAAEPSEGTVGPDAATAGWKGPFKQAAVSESDDFKLVVDAPPSYWADKDGGVTVEITWDDPADDFNLAVFEEDDFSRQVASSTQVGTTSESVFVPDASGFYTVGVTYFAVADSDYDGIATFTSEVGQPAPQNPVVFDDTNPVRFAPATIVSAHFLGSEPQATFERTIPGFAAATDPERIFVDWPLTTRQQISQLSRSMDGGQSFRLLYDPACADRSRPNCGSGGGGDSENEVNLFDGSLYFSDQQGTTSHEALVSSTDHGDSFPATRQHTITNVSTATDRQWLGASDVSSIVVEGRSIRAFLGTRVLETGLFVQGIDADGRPLPQPDPQIPGAVTGGPLRVDTTGGRGHGWVYYAYKDGSFKVATAKGVDYQDPAAWGSNVVTQDNPVIFPWLSLDSAGNAYAVWVTKNLDDWAVFYSYSAIADPRNDPAAGGRPGSHWSPRAVVSLPNLGSTVFGAVAAGDPGRIAIAYMGTDDFRGHPDDAPADARWHTYAAIVTNSLAENGPPVVSTGRVSHRVGHIGQICTEGFFCLAGSDRSLLDLIDVGFDQGGRAGVAFMDNHSNFAHPQGAGIPESPFVHFAKQVSGPSLREATPQVNVSVPAGEVIDPVGDSTWPNTSGGRYLPSLDVRAASLFLEDGVLTAHVPLAATTADLMRLDLASYNAALTTNPPAQRLQYVVRFATDDDIFHLSMESDAAGARRFLGGRLDQENDALTNGFNIFGAGYHTDDVDVTGAVEGGALLLRAPAEQFGLAEGMPLYSVTAFAMAGPSEEEEKTIFHPMRTVDATPPFDTTLGRRADPEPTVSPTPPGPSPTPETSPTVEDGTPASVTLSPSQSERRVRENETLNALVLNSAGAPIAREPVKWSSDGTGELIFIEESTDDSGRARGIARAMQLGTQTVRVATDRCAPGRDCSAEASITWLPVGAECDVVGTQGDDVLQGGADAEVVCGGAGNDVILGGGGDDVLIGGPGNDRLFGGRGEDRLRGNRGDDEIRGSRGRDRLGGGPGADLLWGGSATDALRGGPGPDELRPGGGSRDRLDGGPGRDSCGSGRRITMRSCERTLPP